MGSLPVFKGRPRPIAFTGVLNLSSSEARQFLYDEDDDDEVYSQAFLTSYRQNKCVHEQMNMHLKLEKAYGWGPLSSQNITCVIYIYG